LSVRYTRRLENEELKIKKTVILGKIFLVFMQNMILKRKEQIIWFVVRLS